jgi:hypothetical protein
MASFKRSTRFVRRDNRIKSTVRLPGGVGKYCPVSSRGSLTSESRGKRLIFLLHVTHRKPSLFGKNRFYAKILLLRSSHPRPPPPPPPPTQHARAWRLSLEARAGGKDHSEEELKGEAGLGRRISCGGATVNETPRLFGCLLAR